MVGFNGTILDTGNMVMKNHTAIKNTVLFFLYDMRVEMKTAARRNKEDITFQSKNDSLKGVS